jgi:hypothetical protein
MQPSPNIDKAKLCRVVAQQLESEVITRKEFETKSLYHPWPRRYPVGKLNSKEKYFPILNTTFDFAHISE